MSDSRPIVVTIDANAAIDSNRYADPIKTNGRWVEQIKLRSGSFNGPESMSYEFRGATANGLLVFLAAWTGGGSGRFTICIFLTPPRIAPLTRTARPTHEST